MFQLGIVLPRNSWSLEKNREVLSIYVFFLFWKGAFMFKFTQNYSVAQIGRKKCR